MRSLSKSHRTNRKSEGRPKTKSKSDIWDRVESEKDFKERKNSTEAAEEQARAPSGKGSGSRQTTVVKIGSSIKKSQNATVASKMATPVIDLTNDSSSDDDEQKYPPSLIDVLEHFDHETGEEALGLQIKDTTTLSVKRAKELLSNFKNLKADNNVLDSIIHPRADVSSVSSHVAASRRLMRSMTNIDDEALRKLVGKASEAHTKIVDYLRREKSQKNNVDMITPPGSPGPSTSSKFFRPSNERNSTENAERRPTKGNGNANKLVAIEGPFVDIAASSSMEREVLLVPDEEYIESSDEEMENEPPITDEPSNNDQSTEIDTCSNVPDPDDDEEEQVLLLDSPSQENWGEDVE